jgi:phosphatidylserine decarboxylase
MIPVAAVLVASMRFTFSDIHLHLDYAGPTEVSMDVTVPKGEDLGWFEHGSTIICLIAPQWQWVGPPEGERVKAGDVLWQRNAT